MIKSKIIRFSYVSSLLVNKMRNDQVSKSLWDKIKIELKIGGFIMSQGYKECKKDVSFYYQNFNQKQVQYPEVNQRMYEIRNNLLKLPIIALLFCFPGGIPLILGYMAFLPAFTPTWFLLDTYKSKLDNEFLLKKKEALKYFEECGVIKVHRTEPIEVSTLLNLSTYHKMNLIEKRKVHELCYGEVFDGTSLIRRSFGINLNSFISASFSEFVIEKNLIRRLSNEHSDGDGDQLTNKVIKEATKILREQI